MGYYCIDNPPRDSLSEAQLTGPKGEEMIVEIETISDAKEHGNLFHNLPNQIGRKVGAFDWVIRHPDCGTIKVRQSGKAYDYFWNSRTQQVFLTEAR